MSLGIETFSFPPRVDFNPEDNEHLLALALLQFHGRQHPTLRFKLDPQQYASAFANMVDVFIKANMPSSVLDAAASYASQHEQFVVGTIIDGGSGKIIPHVGKTNG